MGATRGGPPGLRSAVSATRAVAMPGMARTAASAFARTSPHAGASAASTLIKKNTFRFTVNKAFSQVIRSCKELQRKGQDGAWITDELEHSVNALHELGFAYSAEAWLGDELVGGLYGIRMGKFFFGESMFSKASNASKFAFIKYIQQLQTENIYLVDCQVYTEHLESLGAEMIERKEFMEALKNYS